MTEEQNSKRTRESDEQSFIELVNSISRANFKKDAMLAFLEEKHFYDAPASTKYSDSFEGGLVHHALNVYYNLKKLVDMTELNHKYDDDTIKIVSLFHDLYKIDFYEKTIVNKKVYSDNGDKQDALGRYSWVSSDAYKVKEASRRFTIGSNEATSEYILRRFCPLFCEETISILNCTGGIFSAYDNINRSPMEIFTQYPLALLLHEADMMSMCIDDISTTVE